MWIVSGKDEDRMNKLTIEVRQFDIQPQITVFDIIAMMNKKFKNQEQFEMQLDVICTDIAMRLTNRLQPYHCIFYHHTGLLLFDFTEK